MEESFLPNAPTEANHPQLPPDYRALRARGEEHAEREEWADALHAFNAALCSTAAPDAIEAAAVHEMKAQTLLALGEDFEAARSATEATRLDQLFPPAFHTLGRALRNLGELADALRAYEVAAELLEAQGTHAEFLEVLADALEAEQLLVHGFVRATLRGGAVPPTIDCAILECRAHAHAARLMVRR
jgi:tetratricopeptide (TPR) repeat protein